jgi:hypothetical protein
MTSFNTMTNKQSDDLLSLMFSLDEELKISKSCSQWFNLIVKQQEYFQPPSLSALLEIERHVGFYDKPVWSNMILKIMESAGIESIDKALLKSIDVINETEDHAAKAKRLSSCSEEELFYWSEINSSLVSTECVNTMPEDLRVRLLITDSFNASCMIQAGLDVSKVSYNARLLMTLLSRECRETLWGTS